MTELGNRRDGDQGRSRHPLREHFEIAIICALPLEYNALSYLCDEFFGNDGDHDQKAAGDLNHYTTGRIGKHHVVFVLLPGIGKAAATSAAAVLRVSFRNIRTALLVGICGGVPNPSNKHGDSDELFLGDVVIGSSIVQYDFGRQYPNGFETRRSLQECLGRPNKEIRGLLKSLEVDRNRDRLEERTAYHLVELQAEYTKRAKRWSTRYKYPGVDEDRLFRADYHHRHRSGACCSDETTCTKAQTSLCDDIGCEESGLLKDREGIGRKRTLHHEEAQEPAIHIGPIASGDTVMKSGEHRDRIAREDGVVAFETEGAGTWDEISCLLIKGVSDYADSHKDKKWQNFAAATAAAATKALLESIATVERPPRVAEMTSGTKTLPTFEALRREGIIPSFYSQEDAGGRFGAELAQALDFATGNRLVAEIQFHSVLVIDARGQNLPFYLETISSKELFVEVLASRFQDLGYVKIRRGDWSLEDMKTGDVLDLSQPWQDVVKSNQVLIMRMDFHRRRHAPKTNCPSCGFANEDRLTDQVQCTRCRLTYRRIKVVESIEVETNPQSSTLTTTSASTLSTLADTTAEIAFPRPRSPLQLPPDEDIRFYRHVRIVNTSFRFMSEKISGEEKITEGTSATAKPRVTVKLLDLVNTDFLVEELLKHYGLPEEDCKRVLVAVEARLEKFRQGSVSLPVSKEQEAASPSRRPTKQTYDGDLDKQTITPGVATVQLGVGPHYKVERKWASRLPLPQGRERQWAVSLLRREYQRWCGEDFSGLSDQASSSTKTVVFDDEFVTVDMARRDPERQAPRGDVLDLSGGHTVPEDPESVSYRHRRSSINFFKSRPV